MEIFNEAMASAPVPHVAGLPKRIHHTWKHHHVHPLLQRCVDSFRKWNPGWEFHFWTDEDCERLIAEELPDFLPTYLGYPAGILRADIFRIAVLYLRGGVYADLDMECLRPLDDLIASATCGEEDWDVLLARDHPAHERLHYEGRAMWLNAFLIAKPRSRYFRMILNEVARRLKTSDYDLDDPVLATGPGLLTKVVERTMAGFPALGIREIPWNWVHPLPNVFMRFPGRTHYKWLIHQRQWQEGVQIPLNVSVNGSANGSTGVVQEEPPFAAHYWWHSYIEKCQVVNMLTSYGSLLLQSDSEIVERRLGSTSPEECPQSLGEALCLLAERGGKRILNAGKPIPRELARTIEGTGTGLDWIIEAMPDSRSCEQFSPADLVILNESASSGSNGGSSAEIGDRHLSPAGLLLRLRSGEDLSRNQASAPPGLRALSSDFALYERQPELSGEIPPVFHWIEDASLNKWQLAASRSWQAVHADCGWTWRVWTREEADALIADMEPGLLATYHDYPSDQHRRLAARWAILKHHGGVIASPETVCLRPVGEIIRNKTVLFSSRRASDGSPWASDDWVGSTARHPFWNGLAGHLEASRFKRRSEAVGLQFLHSRCRAASMLLDQEHWPELAEAGVLGATPAGYDWLRLVLSENWTALAQMMPDAVTLSMRRCLRQ